MLVPYLLKIPAVDTNEENGVLPAEITSRAVRERFWLTSAVINFGRLGWCRSLELNRGIYRPKSPCRLCIRPSS